MAYSFCQDVRNAILPVLRKALHGQTVQIDQTQAEIVEVAIDKYDGIPVLIARLAFDDAPDNTTASILIEANLLT